MTRRAAHTSLSLPVLIAALIGLVLLATLQYYWVGQVSLGERERRQASLTVSAQRLSEDFDRELARAYLSFQMDAATLRDKDWARYARRYERWRATAPYPGLVKEVFLAEVNQIGRVSLSRYSDNTKAFDTTGWPYELLPLRRQFERTYRQIFAQGNSMRALVDPVATIGPALLVPVARPWLLSNQQDLGIDADLLFSDLIFPGAYIRCSRCPPELLDTPLLAYTIVVLDRDYIAATMFPALAERYFPRSGGLSYNMAVVDQADPEQLIYRSDPRLAPAVFAQGDAVVGLFDITYADLNALMLTSDLHVEGDDASPATDRIAIGVLGRPGDEQPASALADRGHWRLVLKHRDGSLDAAVANLRTRNLLISFGSLLLLGGSIAMLLLSTRRAQRLAQQQIDFASAVSHELRSPLAVICSAGENLADGLVYDPQKARQYGMVISNEGRRLTEMVEQVLAFAGAQSGHSRYEFQRTDVAQVVESALQATQHQLRESGYRVELTIAPNLPMIAADRIALKRSIQNVLSNAMKYGGEQAWIGVDVAFVATERTPELRICVTDRGLGIAPADLPHIFEPFYRGRDAMSMQAHGSGLGLSLVKNAVEAHGGRISVESQLGSGARFTLHLPVGVQPMAGQRSIGTT